MGLVILFRDSPRPAKPGTDIKDKSSPFRPDGRSNSRIFEEAWARPGAYFTPLMTAFGTALCTKPHFLSMAS